MNITNNKSAQNILLGAGGHARSLLGLTKDCGVLLQGCITPEPPEAEWGHGCPWLGGDDVLEQMNRKKLTIINGIGSVRTTTLRMQVFNKIQQKGFKFRSLIHPTSLIAQNVFISQGVQVFPGSIIQPGVNIGENVILNTGCIIEHGCMIGAHSHIAPGAVLSGDVTVEEGVHVGTAATIIQGVHIGQEAVIGAGAVVICDVPSNTVVVGNPARIVKQTF